MGGICCNFNKKETAAQATAPSRQIPCPVTATDDPEIQDEGSDIANGIPEAPVVDLEGVMLRTSQVLVDAEEGAMAAPSGGTAAQFSEEHWPEHQQLSQQLGAGYGNFEADEDVLQIQTLQRHGLVLPLAWGTQRTAVGSEPSAGRSLLTVDVLEAMQRPMPGLMEFGPGLVGTLGSSPWLGGQAYSPHGSHQVGLRALSLSSFQLSTIPNALDTTLADHVTFKSSGPGLRPTPYSSISQRVVLPAIHGSWVRRADGSFGPDDDAVEHWNTGRMQGGSLPLSPSLQRLWQPPETGRMNGGGVKLPGLHTPAESRSHLGPGSPLLVDDPAMSIARSPLLDQACNTLQLSRSPRSPRDLSSPHSPTSPQSCLRKHARRTAKESFARTMASSMLAAQSRILDRLASCEASQGILHGEVQVFGSRADAQDISNVALGGRMDEYQHDQLVLADRVNDTQASLATLQVTVTSHHENVAAALAELKDGHFTLEAVFGTLTRLLGESMALLDGLLSTVAGLDNHRDRLDAVEKELKALDLTLGSFEAVVGDVVAKMPATNWTSQAQMIELTSTLAVVQTTLDSMREFDDSTAEVVATISSRLDAVCGQFCVEPSEVL